MRRASVIFLLALAVLSCSRPLSRETFVLKDWAGVGNMYAFDLDLSDSTVAYSLSFYTRMDRKAFEAFRTEAIPLNIRWISPSDSSCSEKAFLSVEGQDSAYFFKDIISPFKQGFRPFEPGVWRLRVQVPRNCAVLRGLGMICKREE